MPTSDPFHDDAAAGRPRAARAGVSRAWMLLPVLSLVVGVLYVKLERRGERGTRPAPPSLSGPEEIVAWSGSARGDGLVYQARLAPLHADEARLAFDRERLAERLGVGAGGPWRLELRLDADPDGPVPGADAGVDLAALGVHDDAGVGLRPPARPTAADDAPSDPLAVLASAPDGRLVPGHGLVLLLWGERPGRGAAVSGLPVGLALEETHVPAAVTEQPLLRVDATGGER
jgi:hypothetical protein